MTNSLLASFASAFIQDSRILKLRFGPGSGIADGTILPHRLTGSEHLSQCYRYDLDCLTSNGLLDPETVFGQAVQVDIQQADGEHRTISGIVTAVEQRGSNGGFARLGLIIEPALAALGHRFNSRIFQDKTVPEIAQALLDKHLQDNPAVAKSFKLDNRLRKIYQPRSYCNQYRESDLACFERLLAEEGISYYFLFSGGSGEFGEIPVHTLVLFDDAYTLDAAPQKRIRFHRADATEREDSIIDWQSNRQLHSGKSALASFDYKAVSVYGAGRNAELHQGKSGQGLSSTLEDYDPQTLYYGSSTDDINRYARLRQQAKDMRAKTYSGQGTVRSLQAGAWFSLENHPLHEREMPEKREFIVTSLTIDARNNLQQETASKFSKLGLLGQADTNDTSRPYINRFTAVRRGTPIVPLYSRTKHAKPTAPGLQTATVVGPEGEEIYTDEYGRIKVQFHWQRLEDHPEGGANRDDRSSTWVRVAYPSAGARWGHQFIPRVGQEVLIAYVENDIDRPVCVNVLYNGTHMPPDFSDVGKLPANKTLSGIKTKEHHGNHYNQLRFDDTAEQISTQLISEHAHTQLNQGWLGTPRQQGKSEPRGEGFELATDAAGAIRAAKGLLISSDGRLKASGKQLSREELVACLQEARELTQTLADLAEKQNADKTDYAPQESLKQAVTAWEKGTNTDPNGTKTKSDAAGQQPIIAIGSPAGIVLSTSQSMTQYTGKNLDLVSQQDTNQTTGKRWVVNVAESISLFTAGVADKLKKTGKEIAFKLIAAKGKILIQAQDGALEQEAEKDIKLKSNASIKINSRGDTTLVENGGASIELSGGNVTIKCPGNFVVHAADFSLVGPASGAPELPTMPKNEFKNDHGWSISG